jgi:hypothetical protein
MKRSHKSWGLVGLLVLMACSPPKAGLIGAPSTTTSSGTSSGTGGATSAGGVTCGPNAVWRGNVCALLDCADARLLAPCVLSSGVVGVCAEGNCQDFDPLTDPTNCGGYGVVCPSLSQCQGGICFDDNPARPCDDEGSCPAGMVQAFIYSCTATCVWPSCTDALKDRGCVLSPDAGGPGPGPEPQVGVCCGNACVSVYADPTNCGGCGRTCGADGICAISGDWEPRLGTCIARPGCDTAPDNSPCPLGNQTGTCCGGTCRDLSADSENCGACGASCPDGSTCQPQSEFCESPDTGNLGDCTQCPAGSSCDWSVYHCATNSCKGQRDGLACTQPGANESMQCCGGVCIGLGSDSSNCGVCGLQCPADTACFRGLCLSTVSCDAGANDEACQLPDASVEGICCGGQCINPFTDTTNCSGCGVVCPEGVPCSQDCLLSTSCGPGSDLNLCSNNRQSYGTCCQGVCEPEGSNPCYAGVGSCPPDANGDICTFGPEFNGFQIGVCCSGSCVLIDQDPDNCGGCGIRCASGVCSGWSGLCLPAQPDNDCTNGCPTDTLCARGSCVDSFCQNPFYSPSDANTDPCPAIFPGASPFCGLNYGPFFCAAADGNVGLCAPGWFGNGLCLDLANDPQNCGSFGVLCPSGQACQHGVCQGATTECGPGRIGAFCNLSRGRTFACCPGVGCTDIFTDTANCGYCGAACAAGQSCDGGACQ